MNPSQINEEVICVLVFIENTDQIKVDYIEIEKGLEKQFKGLLSLFEKPKTTAKGIVQVIKKHKKLKILFERYDYCVRLNKPYQGFYSTVEEIESNYPSDFSKIDGFVKKEKAKQDEKERLLNQCKHRLQAYYLKKAYKKCARDKKILAYSHRRVGWSAPKYPLNDDFSIQLKTNFGYGSASYFYTKIKYKGLDIIPFSDWVNYRISKIYEIVQYSSKHRLNNESWQDAMEYIAKAYNLSVEHEALFVQNYIIKQGEEMIRGLRKILTNKEIKLKGYVFLNQERGYVDLKEDQHNLNEFRGEKISGALELIPYIQQFKHLIETEGYVEEIEACNIEVKPIIVEEQTNVRQVLERLNTEKDILDRRKRLLSIRLQEYQKSRASLKKAINGQNGIHDKVKLKEELNLQNSDFKKVKTELTEVAKEYRQKSLNINRHEKILENLVEYELKINDYFEEKREAEWSDLDDESNIGIDSLINSNKPFFKELVSLHYPFSKEELIKYWDNLIYGDAYYSTSLGDTDTTYQPSFGLCWNKNIDWDSWLSGKWVYFDPNDDINQNKEFPSDKLHIGFWNPFTGIMEGGAKSVPLDLGKEIKNTLHNTDKEEYFPYSGEGAFYYGTIYEKKHSRFLVKVKKTYDELSIPAVERMLKKDRMVILLNRSIWENTLQKYFTKEVLEELFMPESDS